MVKVSVCILEGWRSKAHFCDQILLLNVLKIFYKRYHPVCLWEIYLIFLLNSHPCDSQLQFPSARSGALSAERDMPFISMALTCIVLVSGDDDDTAR